MTGFHSNIFDGDNNNKNESKITEMYKIIPEKLPEVLITDFDKVGTAEKVLT